MNINYKGNQSNQVSPQKSMATHQSFSTSGVSSNSIITTTNTNSGLEKTMENLSLIQFQQKQLMKQFANMSPIENQIKSDRNSQLTQPPDVSSIPNMTASANNHSDIRHQDRSDLQSTKIGPDCTESLILYSPKTKAHEVSSLLQGSIGDTPEVTLNGYSRPTFVNNQRNLEQIELADETLQQYRDVESR